MDHTRRAPAAARLQRAAAYLEAGFPKALLLLAVCVQLSRFAAARPLDGDSSNAIPSLERPERQAGPSAPPPLDIANASKFIVDLYKDMALRPAPVLSTEPNVVRSIDAQSGTTCDEFLFNLASINSRELVYRADLRVTVKFNRNYIGTWPVMYAVQTSDSPQSSLVTWTIITNTSGDSIPLVINVDQTVRTWVFGLDSASNKIRGFKLLFLNTPYDFNSKVSICGGMSPVSFASEDHPALIVYSRDPDANNIAAQALMKGKAAVLEAAMRTVQEKRQVRNPCSLNSLPISASTLNTIGFLPNQSIFHPNSFEGGICGGSCSAGYPIPEAPAIAHIVHFVVRLRPSTGYSQCCAPIQYGAQSFLTLSGGVTTLVTLDNMRIVKCSCLDIVV